jgi:hypothetical protein
MRDMPDHDVARRTFLRGVTTAAALSYSRVMGANDRVQMALVGCGERGRRDLSNFVKLGVDVVALSDIWDDQLDKAKQIGPNARTFHDYRQVLDLKEVDAALIAVPDHWHAPIGVDALHAGKDVYIEKPLTLKPEEGRGSSRQHESITASARWGCSSVRVSITWKPSASISIREG